MSILNWSVDEARELSRAYSNEADRLKRELAAAIEQAIRLAETTQGERGTVTIYVRTRRQHEALKNNLRHR